MLTRRVDEEAIELLGEVVGDTILGMPEPGEVGYGPGSELATALLGVQFMQVQLLAEIRDRLKLLTPEPGELLQ